jgi:ribosome-binding protein aMBF1 (putative translation factor)
MAKEIQREYRDRRRTSEEVSRDEDVRRKVREEFPPASVASASPNSLSENLKQAIRDSGQSEHQLANAAGVSQIVISRFLSGERDIRMATADKLAWALGLKLATGM